MNPALQKQIVIIYKSTTNFSEKKGWDKDNNFKKGRAG